MGVAKLITSKRILSILKEYKAKSPSAEFEFSVYRRANAANHFAQGAHDSGSSPASYIKHIEIILAFSYKPFQNNRLIQTFALAHNNVMPIRDCFKLILETISFQRLHR